MRFLRRGHVLLGAFVAIAVALAALTATAGQGAKVPQLVWSPSTNGGYDFGTLDPSTNQTASQVFTLTNMDGKTTSTLTVALSGAATFTKTADTCTGKKLNAKKSC